MKDTQINITGKCEIKPDPADIYMGHYVEIKTSRFFAKIDLGSESESPFEETGVVRILIKRRRFRVRTDLTIGDEFEYRPLNIECPRPFTPPRMIIRG